MYDDWTAEIPHLMMHADTAGDALGSTDFRAILAASAARPVWDSDGIATFASANPLVMPANDPFLLTDGSGPMVLFGSEAGGDDATDLGEIVVIGDRPDPWWDIDNLPGSGGSSGSGGDGGGSGTGGGGGAPPPGEQTYAGEDCATQAVKNEIDSKPDANSKEHSAIVYKGADGQYRTSPSFSGASGTAPLAELINWMLSNGVGFNEVTNLYHNHDALSSGATQASSDLNRYPSTNETAANGIGDWHHAHAWVGLGADPNVFKLTVEDPTGRVRDFPYSERSKYETMSAQDMINGKDLPGEVGGCGA